MPKEEIYMACICVLAMLEMRMPNPSEPIMKIRLNNINNPMLPAMGTLNQNTPRVKVSRTFPSAINT